MTEIINLDMEEINIATDVLVIGGGFTGIRAASEIAGLGYKVILIEADAKLGSQKGPNFLVDLNKQELKQLQDLENKIKSDGNIDVLTQTRLVRSAGVTGDFTVELVQGEESIERKVGAIVVASDFSVEILNEKYGLALTENVLAQSQLEALLASDNGSGKAKLANKTVAFLVGFGQEGNPLVMERVMRSILAIEEIDGCTPYVYAGNLKVASDGLERMYKQGREKGAIYFKLETQPDIIDNGKTISFYDSVARRNIELSPDLVIVEEEIRADLANDDLAQLLRIDSGPWGFLQKDNVHLFPVRSNREGIFVIGSSREIFNLPFVWTDVENLSLEIRDLLGDGKKIVPKDKAVVDQGKCVICLTCYRCCPHGAIYWTSEAVISPVACQGCGICASECPMDAIQIGGFNDADMTAAVKTSVAPGNGTPRIVAFCCQNSAYEAGEMADVLKMKVPEGLRMIKVPCAGKIDLEFIMNAFVAGADGVLVMACHPGNCKSEKGNTYAGWRVNDALRMLEEAGFEKDRLRFETIASNMGGDFASIVLDMEQKIKELGVSPFNQ
jgi:heterodisulfide reductase subunit A-like polyferredoxin/coenzyme F420-reducing hydrogenase delta subunit